MAIYTPPGEIGSPCPDFHLPGTDGNIYGLKDFKGSKALLVMFICNHCPYVIAVIGRLVRDAKDLAQLGISTIAINSNDASQYPEDSFEGMQAFARQHAFPFPYLHDEQQSVARAYGAVCTPDFFGFNARLELQYRGRLDASRKDLAPDARRDLYEAMRQVAETGHGPADQIASMGCSIKWKAN